MQLHPMASLTLLVRLRQERLLIDRGMACILLRNEHQLFFIFKFDASRNVGHIITDIFQVRSVGMYACFTRNDYFS